MIGNRQHVEKLNEDLRWKWRKRYAFEFLLCLNCVVKAKGKTHYTSNSNMSDKNTKTSFLEEYRSAKKSKLEKVRKGDDRVACISHTQSDLHCSVFRPSFGKGATETD